MPRYSLGHTSGTDCNDFQAAPQHQLVMALRQQTWKHRGAHTHQKHMTSQFTKTLCFAMKCSELTFGLSAGPWGSGRFEYRS